MAGFLAHEPVLVLAGGRGGRARRESARRSARRAGLLLGAVVLAGGAGLWLAPPPARAATLVPLGLGAVLLPLSLTRREKTAAGELLAAWTLSGALLPVALAAGVELRIAAMAALVWVVTFSLETLAVRGVIAAAKQGKGADRPAATPIAVVAPAVLGVGVCGAGVALALNRLLVPLAALALLPGGVLAVALLVTRVHPRHIRRIGWSLVGTDALVLVLLLMALG